MLILCTVGSSMPGLVSTMLIGLAWIAVRGKGLVAKAFVQSFAACVEIQREEVRREKPDVVVGSSWGDAVAVELIILDEWSGPTILLAPALHTVSAWMGRGDVAEKVARIQTRSTRVPIVIFHDPSDETIPYQHSVQLANSSRIELRSVSAGGHRLMELLHRGELSEAINALVSPR